MRSPTFLTDSTVPLVADTSTVINLIATGRAPMIVEAVPNRIVAADVIPGELDTGRRRGRRDADRLQELVASGHIEIVTLGDTGWLHFESLVAGPALETLDDGEAATIAYAAETNAAAVLDEKKATRLCGARFPGTQVISSIDVLLHPAVRLNLGEETLADAVFDALRGARMKVFAHHLDEVTRLIGPQRAAHCPSLPKGFRDAALTICQAELEPKS